MRLDFGLAWGLLPSWGAASATKAAPGRAGVYPSAGGASAGAGGKAGPIRFGLSMWLLAILLLIVFYATARVVASCYRPDVRLRFLAANSDYAAEGLKEWVDQYPEVAKRQSFRVSIPLDLLVAAALGMVFAVWSMRLVLRVDWPPGWIWSLTVLPFLYFAAHFAETLVLVRFIADAARITEQAVHILKSITRFKIFGSVAQRASGDRASRFIDSTVPPWNLMNARIEVSRSLNASATRNARDHLLRVLPSTLFGCGVERVTTETARPDRGGVASSLIAKPADFQPFARLPFHHDVVDGSEVAIHGVAVMGPLLTLPRFRCLPQVGLDLFL